MSPEKSKEKKANNCSKTGVIAVLLSISVVINAVLASYMICSKAYRENKNEGKDTEAVKTFDKVASDMTNAEYWKSLCKNCDKVIMTPSEIADMNRKILHTEGCAMNDLEKFGSQFDTKKVLSEIAENEIPENDIYISGAKIEKEKLFGQMQNAIDEIDASYSETKYAVAVQRCDIRLWPTDQIVGYSSDDPDDEIQNSSVNTNEPLILTAKISVDNKEYFWAYSTSSKGWVKSENVAVCRTRSEWLGAWQVDINSKDFIVITQSRIITEPSPSTATSEISLFMGTTLKLCPDDELPEELYLRAPLYSYAVYIPIRNADGLYNKELVFIPQHYSISVGYLPLTTGNILDMAFSCLGNRYGWGGMLNSMDCSSYVKAVYACFGLDIPRDTDNQEMIPELSSDISEMKLDDKLKYICDLPPCSLLVMSNHIAMYLGTVEGEAYFINAHEWNFDRQTGKYRYINTIEIIPLSTAAKKQGTWLELFTTSVVFG